MGVDQSALVAALDIHEAGAVLGDSEAWAVP